MEKLPPALPSTAETASHQQEPRLSEIVAALRADPYVKASAKTMTWGPDLDLIPGTIIGISHDRSPRSYLFICTGQQGGSFTDGQLYVTDKSTAHTNRVEANSVQVNTRHPNNMMAAEHKPYMEFTFSHDGTETRITPALGNVYTTHSPKAAQLFAGAQPQPDL